MLTGHVEVPLSYFLAIQLTLLIRPIEVLNPVRAEGERFKLHRAGSITALALQLGQNMPRDAVAFRVAAALTYFTQLPTTRY